MENMIIIAIFWPPLAVYIKYGFGKEFWKNILFTLLGFYPGVIHALRLIETDKRYERQMQLKDLKNGT
jgi:uncharacterized membrane protein YqaE (UPF0057 family)